jgi:meso-butanediol dehydrogenase/(S,S)-butanediol dehydrogenase/diacetyl reductase
MSTAPRRWPKRSAEGHAALAHGVDVSDRASTRALISAAVAGFERIDVMFNNAGFNKPEPFLDISEAVWNRIMAVNGLGVLIGTQEAARQMIAQGGGGKIVNTASIAGRQGFPSFVPYCASKFAVVAITQGAAHALAPHDIRVNAFAPGVVDTPLWAQLDKDLMAMGDSERPGQAMEDFSAGILVGRPATPDDIAGTALFLASADSDYMTGQVIMIDGGMVLV